MQQFGFSLGAMAYDTAPDARDGVLGVMRRLAPHDVDGLGKVRLGCLNDGGYVMLDDFDGIAAAYSLGISDDVSWDMDVARRGIDVFQFDHTIAGLPQHNPRFHWSQIGIGAARSEDGRMDTLEGVMRQRGHAGRTDLLLKCDIEGSEWDVLANTLPAVLASFRQIVIELHALQELHNPFFLQVARQAVNNLTAGHKVVHVHGNNYGAYSIVGGVPVPSVLELTLLRVDERRFRAPGETFPTKLDMPNSRERADYALGHFTF